MYTHITFCQTALLIFYSSAYTQFSVFYLKKNNKHIYKENEKKTMEMVKQMDNGQQTLNLCT